MAAYKLPLTRAEFAKAMELGHGRALLHVKEHGLEQFRDEFLAACVNNLVHDTQCEGSRPRWLVEFFEGVPEWLLRPLLDTYAESDCERDLYQMAELLGLLADRGSEMAKQGLYSGFRVTHWGPLGNDELIRLDGAAALLWMAETMGEMEQIGFQELDSLFRTYDYSYGDGESLRLLLCSSNASIQRAVRVAQTPPQAPAGPWPERRRPGQISAREFLEAVQGEDLLGFPGSWARKAKSEELEIVAQALRTTRETNTLQTLLRCFQGTGLPEFWEGLLALVYHEVREVRRLTPFLLQHHQHPGIRAQALERLEQNRTTEGVFKLFESNFEKGDTKRILTALRRLPTEDTSIYHWALGDVLSVAAANPAKETLALLMFVYENTPCTNCRQKAVLEMRRRGDLPDWVAEECLYDCDFELREKLSGPES